MTVRLLPTLFVSHGSPETVISDDPAAQFLRALGSRVPRPAAILCISAHWETDVPVISCITQPKTIHDFHGFQPALYEIDYAAPGESVLARWVQTLLGSFDIESDLDTNRGLDHGAWVPLKLMYPDADIPIVQLSVQPTSTPKHHLQLGRALYSLREQDVLIIGSGGATHNLHEFGRYAIDADPIAYALEFDQWLERKLLRTDTHEVLAYEENAPHAQRNHPTAEHFLPLFAPLGAAGENENAQRLHNSFTYGVLSMAAYGWGVAQ